MIKTYRKKPVEVEAVLWDGENVAEVLQWMSNYTGSFKHLPDNGNVGGPGVGHVPALGILEIPTLEGVMEASAGDYIIRGVKGEFYPCKPDIFEMTYTEVPYFMAGIPIDGA